MQALRLPPGAVKQAMASEGFSGPAIEAFLQGLPLEPHDLPPAPPSSSAAPGPQRRMSVWDEIQLKGAHSLRPLDPAEVRQGPRAAPQGLGMLGALARAMADRRCHIEDEKDEEDSDSGWSDTDSD